MVILKQLKVKVYTRGEDVLELYSGDSIIGKDIRFSIAEIEEQRLGRNKETAINHTYINGGEYRRKFDEIADNGVELSRMLFQLSKEMLEHRSGTEYEDMYWVDLDTFKVIAKETECEIKNRINYSMSTERKIAEYDNILTIHSHPNSFPPSVNDLNSNYFWGYTIGIVVGHDGSVYMYSANEEINRDYYNLVVEEYLKEGYNENESQIMALYELRRKFDIEFKEVTGYVSI